MSTEGDCPERHDPNSHPGGGRTGHWMDEVVLAWSGGKDCSFALAELRAAGVNAVELLTTINVEHDRSTMHGVRRSLHERQAAALGRPIRFVELPPEPDNETYEAAMARELDRYRRRGIGRVVFADVFLEDVRRYREDQLEGTELEGWWPLWNRDTAALAEAFVDRGFEAVVVAADAELLDASAVGRRFDREFLRGLPPDVDPCGEHGEFHTFVHNGPIFEEPVPVEVGETVTQPVGEGEFHYADIRLASGG